MNFCIECQRCYDDPEVKCIEEGHSAVSYVRDGGREVVPGYQLDYFLGADIRGEIYRAHQTASGGSCLIRIFAADETSGEFLSDAELAAALFHPNVVDVYEAGCLPSGEAFVVSEDADGSTLRDLLDEVGVPDLLTTIRVVRQTAEALYALHLNGITHGAINPENIILTTDAESRLLARIKDPDFGGSTERSVISNHFLIDRALEMLRYFSPEQCSSGVRSAQSDVYGLGIVMHEMLAGAPPFNASKAAGLIAQHKRQRPPEIKINNFDLRMLLTHTLTEALQKQPEMRQKSANAFARQMRHIEQLATHSSLPPPAVAIVPASSKPGTVFESGEPVVRRPETIIDPPRETYEEDIELTPVGPEPDALTDIDEIVPAIAAESTVDDLPDPQVCKPAVTAEPAEREIQVEAEPVEVPIIQTGPAEAPVVSARKIEWEPPEDDIPSEADVLEALAEDPAEDVPALQGIPETVVIVPAYSSQIALDLEPSDVPESFLSDEDIRPTDWQIIGSSGSQGKTVDAVGNDELFSSYSGPSGGRHRSGMVIGGLVFMTALFFIGRAVLSDPVPADSPSEPPVALTVPEQQPAPEAVQPDAEPPVPQTALGDPQPPAQEQAEMLQIKGLPSKVSPLTKDRPEYTAADSSVKAQPAPKPVLVSRNFAPPPSSTLVITYGNGRIRSKVETDKSSVDKNPAPAAKKTADFTRPRIVKNPRQ